METNNDGADYHWAATGIHSNYILIQRIDGASFVYSKDAADKVKGGNACLVY
jgi:hypothetical protein